MRFTGTFVSLALLVATTSARPSLLEMCGPDAQIIEQESLGFTDTGAEVTRTTRSCPGFATLRNVTRTPSTVHKRQVVQEPSSCNQVSCDTTAEQPTFLDCSALTTFLLHSSPQFFTVNPGVLSTSAIDGNCQYGFGNLDTVAYSVFNPSFGAVALDAVTDCSNTFGTLSDPATAAFCVSPEVPGNDWIVEAVFI